MQVLKGKQLRSADDTVSLDSHYDAVNKAVFRSRRKSASNEAALTDAGKAFQARAAATGKARSPSVTRLVDGTISVGVAADRSRRSCSTSADWRRDSAR